MPVINVEPPKPKAAPTAVDFLLELNRRARTAESVPAVEFIAVNDSHLLAPYQQTALWFKDRGIAALSGLMEVDANVPYVQWLSKVVTSLDGTPARAVSEADLPEDVRKQWSEWLPAYGLWIPFGRKNHASGGLFLARDVPWRDLDVRLFAEWVDTWFCAYRALSHPSSLSRFAARLRQGKGAALKRPLLVSALALAIALCPVRLSVLAPGELVPAAPIAVRAPLDGVIKTFFIKSNEAVKADQPLFAYDDASMASKLEIAAEELRTAEAEQRQMGQMALSEAKARAALAAVNGRVEEKRVEVDFLRTQLTRNRVVAPRDGIAFVDDPNEWIGRPVVTGQRILRLADPADKEIEAWLAVGDAIELSEAAPAKLYVATSPLAPVTGQVTNVSYEAHRRPDGSYAYRVRAKINGATDHRVGLKGTVRLSGDRVPLCYWLLRRPLAAFRQYAGF